jgi:hypothetical protein
MKPYTYTFKVHHDTGSFTVSIVATSVTAARLSISRMENCPLSALELIEYHDTL